MNFKYFQIRKWMLQTGKAEKLDVGDMILKRHDP